MKEASEEPEGKVKVRPLMIAFVGEEPCCQTLAASPQMCSSPIGPVAKTLHWMSLL